MYYFPVSLSHCMLVPIEPVYKLFFLKPVNLRTPARRKYPYFCVLMFPLSVSREKSTYSFFDLKMPFLSSFIEYCHHTHI